MSTTNQNLDVFDKSWAWFSNSLRNMKLNLAKNKFQEEIQSYIKLANAHKAKGVKKGDPVYGELYTKCIDAITCFTSTWGGNVQSILMGSPALRELKGWAIEQPDEEKYKALANEYGRIAIGIAITAIVISPFAVGIWWSVVQIIHHAMTFWIHS